jgi:NAD(P)H-flavin reductase
LVGGTSLYQIIHAVLNTKDDGTKVSLLMSSKSPEDTPFLGEFEEFMPQHKDRSNAWFTVGKSDLRE